MLAQNTQIARIFLTLQRQKIVGIRTEYCRCDVRMMNGRIFVKANVCTK